MTCLLRLFALIFLSVAGTAAQAAPRCDALGADAVRAIAAGTTGRAAAVHVAGGRTGSVPMPLVVLLHGSGASGAAMLADSGLGATADRHGFLIVAPDAGIPHDRGHVWNIPGVPTVTGALPGPDAPDDAAHIGAMIDRLVAAGCVDPARVYATGLSGGGRMTSWLGCVATRRFAAIAPVVGLRAGNPLAGDPTRPDPATCRPAVPLPVVAFAGDADRTNPIQGGGAPYWSYTMHAAEMRWASRNGCTAAPTTRWVAPGVYEERYTRCRGGADVVGRITVGGGHSWVVDNEALWALLSAHRR